MFFITNKVQLERAIRVLREDRVGRRQSLMGPWMRIEASELGQLTVSTRKEEAMMPATVYEAGVLFLKVTGFRRLLHAVTGQKLVTIQVNERGLVMDNIEMPFAANEFVLYEVPATAPQRCPLDKEPEVEKPQSDGPVTSVQSALFSDMPDQVTRAKPRRPRKS